MSAKTKIAIAKVKYVVRIIAIWSIGVVAGGSWLFNYQEFTKLQNDHQEAVWVFENRDISFLPTNVAEAKFEGNPEVLSIKTPSQMDVIKKVASEEGINWKVLYGIFLKETQGNCTRIGDTHLSKASVGCYQISRIYHPEVTDDQAMDLEWSSRWTAKRLKLKAEKFGMDTAIALHNGNPKLPQVQKYLQDVKENMSKL